MSKLDDELAKAESLSPKVSLPRRIWLRLKGKWNVWSQCPNSHQPYAHLSDEECRHSFVVSCEGNRKRYRCMRNRWHFGRCQDHQGERFY